MSAFDTKPNPPAETPSSIDALKERMRATWMGGDYSRIAAIVEGAAREFVAKIALREGASALDIACGTGNVTIPLAQAGAHVTGVDIAPNLLEEARARAQAAGVSINFDEGDAEHLPYADASFNLVTSMFGTMFAPRPALVALEMARVLRPGGVLAMANWTPASFTAAIFRTTAKHVPPPAGIESPLLWGDAATVEIRLAQAFTKIKTEVVPVSFELPMNAVKASALFRLYYGPTKAAFARLDSDGQAKLGEDLDALWSGAALTTPTGISVPNEYLLVVATRPH